MAGMTLAEVDTAINALLTTPEVDYRIGQKTVKAGDKIKQLMAYRKHLLDNPTAEIEFANIDMSFDEFGVSRSELQD